MKHIAKKFYFGRELVERKTFDCVACRIKQPKTSERSLLKFWPKNLTENSLRLITNGMDQIFCRNHWPNSPN